MSSIADLFDTEETHRTKAREGVRTTDLDQALNTNHMDSVAGSSKRGSSEVGRVAPCYIFVLRLPGPCSSLVRKMTNRREYGWVARVGLIVPPGSTTVEPEIESLMPDGVAVYVSRLPGEVQADTSLGMRERLIGYDTALPDVASRLSGAGLDVVWFAHTASSYLAGMERESEITEALTLSGARRLITAAEAIVEGLTILGCKRLGIVSPYPDWLTELAVGYWASRGFDISQIVQVSGPASLYNIVAEQVVDAADRLDLRTIDGILLSGTGMPTFRALDMLADRNVPVVSANMCFVWWLFRNFGSAVPPPKSTVLRKLLATIPASQHSNSSHGHAAP